jgi:hypothetical protein
MTDSGKTHEIPDFYAQVEWARSLVDQQYGIVSQIKEFNLSTQGAEELLESMQAQLAKMEYCCALLADCLSRRAPGAEKANSSVAIHAKSQKAA